MNKKEKALDRKKALPNMDVPPTGRRTNTHAASTTTTESIVSDLHREKGKKGLQGKNNKAAVPGAVMVSNDPKESESFTSDLYAVARRGLPSNSAIITSASAAPDTTKVQKGLRGKSETPGAVSVSVSTQRSPATTAASTKTNKGLRRPGGAAAAMSGVSALNYSNINQNSNDGTGNRNAETSGAASVSVSTQRSSTTTAASTCSSGNKTNKGLHRPGGAAGAATGVSVLDYSNINQNNNDMTAEEEMEEGSLTYTTSNDVTFSRPENDEDRGPETEINVEGESGRTEQQESQRSVKEESQRSVPAEGQKSRLELEAYLVEESQDEQNKLQEMEEQLQRQKLELQQLQVAELAVVLPSDSQGEEGQGKPSICRSKMCLVLAFVVVILVSVGIGAYFGSRQPDETKTFVPSSSPSASSTDYPTEETTEAPSAPPSCSSKLDDCAAIKISSDNLTDGNYLITNQANCVEYEVYCEGMATNDPKEYLTLATPNQFETFDHTIKAQTTTTFTKVRFDPKGLQLITLDSEFATPGASGNTHEFGFVADCEGGRSTSGSGVVDLRGSPFAVASGWIAEGYQPGEPVANGSFNNQLIELKGGGSCGGICPSTNVTTVSAVYGDYSPELGTHQISCSYNPDKCCNGLIQLVFVEI